jgi:hypothetical protein
MATQIMLAVGLDTTTGNPVSLYCGEDASAAKTAFDDAGTAGTVNIGFLYRNPEPQLTLRYGPGLPAAVSAGS